MPHGGTVTPCNGLQYFQVFYQCICKSPSLRVSLTDVFTRLKNCLQNQHLLCLKRKYKIIEVILTS